MLVPSEFQSRDPRKVMCRHVLHEPVAAGRYAGLASHEICRGDRCTGEPSIGPVFRVTFERNHVDLQT